MMEDEEIRAMFIDKCCVFMGDFMNGKGTGATIDLIKTEAMEEFVAHRDKYNPGWGWWPVDNRSEINNKFNDAKNWAEGRPNYFYQHIAQQWNLGTPVALTVNTSKQNVDITINGIELSENTFDGKFFANRQLTITGTALGADPVTGWRLSGARNEDVAGSELTINMTSSALNIEPIIGELNGIKVVDNSTLSNQSSPIYDLKGNRVMTPKAGEIYIQNGRKISWR